MATIKIRRGLKQDLPSEGASGEPLFCTDTKELYIGVGPGSPPVKIAAFFQADGGNASSVYGGTQGINGGGA